MLVFVMLVISERSNCRFSGKNGSSVSNYGFCWFKWVGVY